MSDRPEQLEIRNLATGYARRPVIKSLTLAPLHAGQVTALVGPNAAGKSTLMLALAGLLPASGSVRLGDIELVSTGLADRVNLVAFMPQALPQAVSLTVIESVVVSLKASPLGTSGLSLATIHERAVETLQRLSIAHLALEPLDRLSGGQRQLVSLAQAICRQPRVLLLDEPTSALDLRYQVAVMGLVRELAREGRIVVIVLHDLNLATRWADHIVVLRDGDVFSEGEPRKVVTAAMLAIVYGVNCNVERSSRGHIHVSVEGVAENPF